jgi:hypothetical protein
MNTKTNPYFELRPTINDTTGLFPMLKSDTGRRFTFVSYIRICTIKNLIKYSKCFHDTKEKYFSILDDT